MAIILAIPSYYRADSYVFVPKGDERPTTTARYIVLTPASSEILTTRNAAIAKDVAEWGWHVYNTDPSTPKMKKWFKKYDKAVKKSTWDDDIWRIWQREHGFRISEKHAELKRQKAVEEGKIAVVRYQMEKAGVLFGRFAMTIDETERRMRKEEAGKEGERAEKENERRRMLADAQLADEQLAGTLTDIPDDPFADPPPE